MKTDNRFMTARQAAAALGISLGTLYSYVSRGMLRSDSVAGKPRVRQYRSEDVARLVERKDLRKNPASAAARGLHWGSPVLESALTFVHEGRLFYRGVDAIELAQHSTVEEVAALLWTGDSHRASQLFLPKGADLTTTMLAFLKHTPRLGPVERCQLVLSAMAATDLAAYDLRPDAVSRTGARILRLMLAAVCAARTPGPIDATLIQAWVPSRRAVAPALRAAMILCADHELNVSAFTARCIASAQATPYAVVTGALAALRGLRHGGASEEIETLFRETESAHTAREVMAKRLRISGVLPGFGHPLYPGGDPRASLLISLARTYGRRRATDLADSLVRAAHSLTGDLPNVDFGLVALARALGLPPEAPIALFALGRTVGWIAHAIEQYADPQLIRPRARYVGPEPLSGTISLPRLPGPTA
jgi:citrate synthase